MLASIRQGTEKGNDYFYGILLVRFSGTAIPFKGFVFTCRSVFFLNVFEHVQGGKDLYTEYQITGFDFPE